MTLDLAVLLGSWQIHLQAERKSPQAVDTDNLKIARPCGTVLMPCDPPAEGGRHAHWWVNSGSVPLDPGIVAELVDFLLDCAACSTPRHRGRMAPASAARAGRVRLGSRSSIALMRGVTVAPVVPFRKWRVSPRYSINSPHAPLRMHCPASPTPHARLPPSTHRTPPKTAHRARHRERKTTPAKPSAREPERSSMRARACRRAR